MSLLQVFTKAKDHVLGAAGKATVRRWLAPYGNMLDLSIDTENKIITASILLKGEVEPISVQLNRYQLEEEDGRTYVSIDPADLTVSRAWINQLLSEKLKPNRLEIPSQYSWIIKLLA